MQVNFPLKPNALHISGTVGNNNQSKQLSMKDSLMIMLYAFVSLIIVEIYAIIDRGWKEYKSSFRWWL
jgi:hypothetical protein